MPPRLTSLIVFLAFSTLARAELPSSLHFFPMGEREAFLANAGTGSPSSGAAVYYNPGALSRLPHSRFSAQGSSYQSLQQDIETRGSFDGVERPQKLSSFQVIPNAVVSTVKRDSWTFASALLVPFSLQQASQTEAETPNYKTSGFSYTQNRDLWIGGGIGRELFPGWSFGVSIFGIYSSNLFQSFDRQAKKDSTELIVTAGTTEYSSFRSLLVAGVLTNVTPDWSVGLRVQTPSLTHMKKGNVILHSDVYNSAAVPPLTTFTSKGPIDIHITEPLDVQIGNEVRLAENLSVLVDVAYQFGSKLSLSYDTITDTHTYKAAPRIRTGVEWAVLPSFFLRAGYGHYWLPLEATAYNTTIHVNAATAGIRWSVSERILTSLGGAYQWSLYKEKVPDPDNREVNASLRIWSVLLSMGYIL